MQIILLVLYVIACVLLILAVLVQSGKGASLSGLLGSGGGDTIFAGGTGNVFLKKVTAILAGIFVLGALALTAISFRQPRASVVDKMTSQMPPSAPSAPAPSAPTTPVQPPAAQPSQQTGK